MTGYAGSRDYVGSSLREKPHTDPNIPLGKMILSLSWQTPTLSFRVFCARNSQQEGRSLPRQGGDHLTQWDVGISVGFFTDTTGSLRNPETRRTPSYDSPDNEYTKYTHKSNQ